MARRFACVFSAFENQNPTINVVFGSFLVVLASPVPSKSLKNFKISSKVFGCSLAREVSLSWALPGGLFQTVLVQKSVSDAKSSPSTVSHGMLRFIHLAR
jgi:hypothetical protein